MTLATYFIVAVLGCCTINLAEAATVDPLSLLINAPPYRSAFGFNRLSYINDLTYDHLRSMAFAHNINLSDMLQMYGILDAHTHMSPEMDIAFLENLTSAIDRERVRRGYRNSFYGMDYFFSQRNAPLQKREPQLATAAIRDTLSNLGAAYDNMTSMMDYMLPNISSVLRQDMYDMLYGSIPGMASSEADSLVNNMSSNIRSMLSEMI